MSPPTNMYSMLQNLIPHDVSRYNCDIHLNSIFTGRPTKSYEFWQIWVHVSPPIPSTKSVFKSHVLRYLLSESTCVEMWKQMFSNFPFHMICERCPRDHIKWGTRFVFDKVWWGKEIWKVGKNIKKNRVVKKIEFVFRCRSSSREHLSKVFRNGKLKNMCLKLHVIWKQILYLEWEEDVCPEICQKFLWFRRSACGICHKSAHNNLVVTWWKNLLVDGIHQSSTTWLQDCHRTMTP